MPGLHQKPSLVGTRPTTKCQGLPRSTCPQQWPAPARACSLGIPASLSTSEASPVTSPPPQVLSLTLPSKELLGPMVMGDPGREEYKIQSFDAETQQLLKTALKGELGEPS